MSEPYTVNAECSYGLGWNATRHICMFITTLWIVKKDTHIFWASSNLGCKNKVAACNTDSLKA